MAVLNFKGKTFVQNHKNIPFNTESIMKRIELIPIAEKKSKRRGIKREWIDDAVTNPMQLAEGYGNRKVAPRNCY